MRTVFYWILGILRLRACGVIRIINVLHARSLVNSTHMVSSSGLAKISKRAGLLTSIIESLLLNPFFLYLSLLRWACQKVREIWSYYIFVRRIVGFAGSTVLQGLVQAWLVYDSHHWCIKPSLANRLPPRRHLFLMKTGWAISELSFVSFSKQDQGHDLSKMTSICKWMKSIFTWNAVHQDSLWKRGTRQLRNGCPSTFSDIQHPMFYLVSVLLLNTVTIEWPVFP